MTIERPMFPPVDPTRRHLLAVAAGGAVAAAVGTAASRATPDATGFLRSGSLELDLTNRTLRRGGRSFKLRPREFGLLKYMMERSGQLLTRAKLIQDVWGYKFIPESTAIINVNLCGLRRMVDAPNEPPMIRTVRGAGFILNATDQAAVQRGGES
jgi:DNA-binding response OmpR family regulator